MNDQELPDPLSHGAGPEAARSRRRPSSPENRPSSPENLLARHLDLETSRELVRQYAWLERALFEIAGGWVASIEDPAARVQLETSSRHHVLHAELWEDLTVGLGGSTNDAARPECADDLAPLLQQLRAADNCDTLERMVGYYRVLLPRLIGAYTIHAQRTGRTADLPASRVLRIVLLEEIDEWTRGEIMLQTCLAGKDAITRAARRQEALEIIADSCRFTPATDLIWGSRSRDRATAPE